MYHQVASLERMVRRAALVILSSHRNIDINQEGSWPSADISINLFLGLGIPMVRDGVVTRVQGNLRVIVQGTIYKINPEVILKVDRLLEAANPKQFGSNAPWTVDDLFAQECCLQQAHVG